MKLCLCTLLAVASATSSSLLCSSAAAFQQQSSSNSRRSTSSRAHGCSAGVKLKNNLNKDLSESSPSSFSSSSSSPPSPHRRTLLSGILTSWTSVGLVATGSSSQAALAAQQDNEAEAESFASIAARASKISKDMDRQDAASSSRSSSAATSSESSNKKSDKTAYDFTLPVEGKQVAFADLIRQEFFESGDDVVKVKAIIVTNIKQDDPVARKTIPELISLASKYSGRGNDNYNLAIVACPTDQGYYEPDTSALIRLKLASEYGYGINPATTVTDKVNLLGSGAHPFWRWLESTCRTPAGLGRIEGNFEKFLVDGRTGQPLRRYPRKYAPLNMQDDIEAVIAGKPLPPAKANWQEEWRAAAVESERDTYRFEKGLNYFDQ